MAVELDGANQKVILDSDSDTYLYAANQDSGDIQAYKINEETGELDAIGEPVAVPTPVCIEFLK